MLRNIFLKPKLRNNLFDDERLSLAMRWLCRAQDVSGDDGVSAAYYLKEKKWAPSYREVTGYTIPTFLNYAELTKDGHYIQRALKMGDFEIEVQNKDGSFGEVKDSGSVSKKVFNTGQIILGLISLSSHSKEEKYFRSAVRAGDWLVANQDSDGAWRKHTTQGAKTYHARVAWALLVLAQHSQDKKYSAAAEKNLKWILDQQKRNGWFLNTSLHDPGQPITHLIAYTIRGLLESAELVGGDFSKELFDSAKKSSSALLKAYSRKPGAFFDHEWRGGGGYSCLTGDLQIAIIWMKLYQKTNDKIFMKSANELIKKVSRSQVSDGGIPGSSPIRGQYCPFMIISWATKFFVDALMLKTRLG